MKRRAAFLALPFFGGAAHAQSVRSGNDPGGVAADIKRNIKWFNPVADYGCPTDGTTACDKAFANMMADVTANGGGVIWVPFNPLGYKFTGNAAGWTINMYNKAAALNIHLNGNVFNYTGSGWFIDVPTNYFPIVGDGFRNTINIYGGGATINGTPNATGAVRFTDCMKCRLEYIYIENFTSTAAWKGRGIQIALSANDGSRYSENMTLSNISVGSALVSFETTFPTEVAVGPISFDGMCIEFSGGGTGTLSNGTLFRLNGVFSRCRFVSIGGFYGYGGATGVQGFYLNGYFISTTFISPFIDTAGGGTSSAATDIVFGPQYTGDPQGHPVFVNPQFLKLPASYWRHLNVVGDRMASTATTYLKAEQMFGAIVYGHAPFGAAPGSKLMKVGSNQLGDAFTVDWRTGAFEHVTSFGYGTGAGGTVMQTTSKSTGVTLNKLSGQITMNNAALAAGAKVSFIVTNSTVAATDVIVAAVASGGTANAYRAAVTALSSGSFTITVENIANSSLSESPVINFNVIKGANS